MARVATVLGRLNVHKGLARRVGWRKISRMSDKQLAMEAVGSLPEDVSLDQIASELDIMAGIRKGQEDIQAGRVKSHDQVKRMFDAWAKG
jgi:predicted transcriptional regulator